MYTVGRIVTEKEVNDLETQARILYASATPMHGLDNVKNVFFHKKCPFSRKKFKEVYPEKNIVVKWQKADVLVVRPSTFTDFSFHRWRLFNKGWGSSSTHVAGKLDYEDARLLNEGLRTIELLKSGKPYMDDRLIEVKAHYNDVMSIEQRNGVRAMIDSDDEEMIKLGWNTLTSFDIDTNEENYAVCLFPCKRLYRFPGGREYAVIRQRIRAKFPNLKM